MRIDCALLCDAATVREGLLHVLGGGVTRLTRPTYPAPLGVAIAARILVHPTEAEDNHHGRIVVQAEDGEQLAEVTFDFRSERPPGGLLASGEEMSLPVVVPLQNVGVPAAGGYSVEILIDRIHQASLPFRVVGGQ